MRSNLIRVAGPGVPQAVSAGFSQWQLGIDSEVTGLIVGVPQDPIRPGERILPWRTTKTVGYRFPTFDLKRFKAYETKRGLSADIRTARLIGGYDRGETVRHTFAYEYDVAEIANRDASGNFPLNIREMASFLAREAVLDDIERERAALLTATGTYTHSNSYDRTGSEWNGASSDSRLDISTAADAISLRTGASRLQMVAYLSLAASMAALADIKFLAARSGTGSAGQYPTLTEWARYVGIGDAWTADPKVLNTAETAIEGLYGDSVILYLPSKPSGQDDMFGTYQPGATFTTKMGAALVPWEEKKNTTVYFPFEQWANVEIFDDSNMALLYNVAA